MNYIVYRSSTHSNVGANKHRRRAAQAQELLYASKNVDQQHPQRETIVRVPSASSFLRFNIFLFSTVMSNSQVMSNYNVKLTFLC